MKLRTIPEREMDSALDGRIRAMLCICFPKACEVFAKSRAWHGSAPSWTVIVEEDEGIVCGHLGIVDRVIQVGGKSLRVAGIQNVCVLPGWRGKGVATRVLEAAVKLMCDRGFDAGLLFCTTELTRFYVAGGWRLIEETSVMRTNDDGANARLPEGSNAMWMPARTATWPEGDIHLCGNDW